MARIAGLNKTEGKFLLVTLALQEAGHTDIYGFKIAAAYRDVVGDKRILPFATLYNILDRLEELAYLVSQLERDEPVSRPRRRYYTVTEKGKEVCQQLLAGTVSP